MSVLSRNSTIPILQIYATQWFKQAVWFWGLAVNIDGRVTNSTQTITSRLPARSALSSKPLFLSPTMPKFNLRDAADYDPC